MNKIAVINDIAKFRCPGCHAIHRIPVASTEYGSRWSWNGSLSVPTFNPSILTRIQPTELGRPEKICHSFVRTGRIEFLGDCTHSLAGQTVDLPVWTPETPDDF
jgi:hypothetical protein